MAKKSKSTEGEAPESNTSPRIKIEGVIFDVVNRYAEGHPLSALEAKTLNQTLFENYRNNFSKTVKKAKEDCGGELTPEASEALHAAFAKYAEAYEFSKRAPAAVLDPVEKLATKLAKEAVLAALRQKGTDPKTLPEGNVDALVAAYLPTEKAQQRVWAEARRRIAAASEVAGDALEGLI